MVPLFVGIFTGKSAAVVFLFTGDLAVVADRVIQSAPFQYPYRNGSGNYTGGGYQPCFISFCLFYLGAELFTQTGCGGFHPFCLPADTGLAVFIYSSIYNAAVHAAGDDCGGRTGGN